MMNFNTLKNATAVNSAARDSAFETLVAAFSEVYGSDNVSVVGNSEIAVAVGERTLSDGTTGEVCITIKPVVKNFDFRTTASGKTFEPYERLTAADIYEMEKTEKERKAEKKAKEKAVRAARDKAAREKKAAEKAAAKAAKENGEN